MFSQFFFYYSKMYINKITQFTYDLNPKAISFEKKYMEITRNIRFKEANMLRL